MHNNKWNLKVGLHLIIETISEFQNYQGHLVAFLDLQTSK